MTTPEEWVRMIGDMTLTPDAAALESIIESAMEQAFSDGYMAGATAYAAAHEHSCLMRDNEVLRRLRDGMPERIATLFIQDSHTAVNAPKERET